MARMLVDQKVYDLAADWLSDRTMLPNEREAIIMSLAGEIQRAIEDWEIDGLIGLHIDTAVTDASGRLVAPPQPTTPARPSGPHDGNADAREPVKE